MTKPGYKTTEFWIAAVTNVAGASLAILAARGLLTRDESRLWLALVEAIAVAAAPVAMALVNKAYIDSRTRVKETANRAGAQQVTIYQSDVRQGEFEQAKAKRPEAVARTVVRR